VACGSAAVTTGRHRPGRLEARASKQLTKAAAPYIINLLRQSHYTSVTSQSTVTMSTKAKTTLAGTILGTIGIVYFVHYQQVADKAVGSDVTVSLREQC
jgi:hypothetical protein